MNEKEFDTKSVTHDNDVISFYDDYADNWDRRFLDSYSNDYFIKSRWFSIENFINKHNLTNKVALELGVGTGVYLPQAIKFFKNITAVDGSKKMIDQVNKRISSLGLSNIKAIVSNVNTLDDIPSASIDVIYFFGLIEHIIDPKAFITEMDRVLKPGGVIMGCIANDDSPWYKIRRLVRGTGMHCSTDRYYSLKKINAVFVGHNIKVIDYKYWGGIPGGINNKIVFNVLKALESFISHTPLKKYMGGISFVAQKS